MKGIGKDRLGPILIIIILFAFFRCGFSQSYYYTCSYEIPRWGSNVLFSKIDLESNTVLDTVSIPIRGEIFPKIPIIIERNSRKLFIVTSFDGLSGKNTELLPDPVTNYAVIGQEYNVLRIGQLEDIQITKIELPVTFGIWLKFINNLGAHKKGRINLRTDFRFDLLDIEDDSYNDSDYPEISGFRYFKKIEYSNDRMYWNTTGRGQYLLSINIQNSMLIDSLLIEADGKYSNLYGLSNDDSLVYVFYMNHNYMGNPADMRKLEIDQSYVKIFDTSDFSLRDSIDIIYPPIDSGYVGRETGSVDKIGPYFVYYFFSGEDYRYFSPAMLFIFDTRTNEANWLRVGWR